MAIDYLLQEIGDKILLEDSSGFILLDFSWRPVPIYSEYLESDIFLSHTFKSVITPVFNIDSGLSTQLDLLSKITKEIHLEGNLCR